MDETLKTPETPVAVKVEKPSRLRAFRTNHPRVTRALTLTGAAVVLVGGTSVYKNAKQNKEQLALAADKAKEALSNLSDSVTSPDTEA